MPAALSISSGVMSTVVVGRGAAGAGNRQGQRRGRGPTGDAARVVVPALNEMIDVTTARTVAKQTRLPAADSQALPLALAVLSAFVAGYAMAARRLAAASFTWLLYAVAVSLTTYIVFDLDNSAHRSHPGCDSSRCRRCGELHDSIR